MTSTAPGQPIFEAALSRFTVGLSKEERQNFRFATLEDVHVVIDQIQVQQGNERKRRNLVRMQGFLEAMQQFGSVIEIFLNASEFVAFIWGPVKFLLTIANTWTNSLDILLDAYESIGKAIPLLLQYENLLKSNVHIRRILGYMYTDILEFHRRAMIVFKRKAWEKLFHSTWKTFDTHFRRLLANMEGHAALIQKQATLIEIENHQELLEAQKLQAERNEKQENSRMMLAVEEKLCPPNTALDHETASSHWTKAQSFGLWLLENSKMKSWLNEVEAEADVLWMKGIPGAGKTILTSRLVAMLQELGDKKIVYFYCKYNDKLRSSQSGLMRSLICQLLAVNPGVLPFIFEQCIKIREPTIETIKSLQSLLQIALDQHEPLWVIVDGLDECQTKERKRILSFLLPLVHSSSQGMKIRLLVVSQDEGDIAKVLRKAPCITLQDTSAHMLEIKAYTARKIVKIQKVFDLSKQESKEIGDQVFSGSNGMFLYARLLLKHLRSQVSLVKLRTEVAPSQFPKGLNQVYDRIVRRIIDGTDRETAVSILKWVVCAQRPLRCNELQSIFCMDVKTRELDFEGRYLRDIDGNIGPDSCHSRIKQLCGSLVEITPDHLVRLVHETAKIYLTVANDNDPSLISTKSVDIMIAQTCLDYLGFPCFETNLNLNQCINNLQRGQYALQEYSLVNWIHHLDIALQCITTYEPELLDMLSIAFERALQVHSADLSGLSLGLKNKSSTEMKEQLIRHTAGLMTTKGKSSSKKASEIKCYALNSLDELQRRRAIFETIIETKDNDPMTDHNLRRFYGPHGCWFKCPSIDCYGFWEGFPSRSDRDSHAKKHERPFKCQEAGCLYASIGFSSSVKYQQHKRNNHPFAPETAKEVTFPSRNSTSSTDPQRQGYLDATDPLVWNGIANELSLLDLSTVPNTHKTLGNGWHAIHSLPQPRNYDLELSIDVKEESVVATVAISSDGRYFAVGSNKLITVHSIETKEKIKSLDHPWNQSPGDNYVRSVKFDPQNSSIIAAGSEDKLLRAMVWDDPPAPMRIFSGHEQDVYNIDYSTDGSLIASCSEDCTARLWYAGTGLAYCPPFYHTEPLTTVVLSPDSKTVAAGCKSNTIVVWDITTQSKIASLSGHSNSAYGVARTMDGTTLYSCGLDKTIRSWDLNPASGSYLELISTITGPQDFALSMTLSGDDSLFFVASRDRYVYVYDREKETALFLVGGHRNSVISVAVCPRSTRTSGMFVTGSGDMRARLWKYTRLDVSTQAAT